MKTEEKVELVINGDLNNIVEFPKKLYDECVEMSKKMGITFDEFLNLAIQNMLDSYGPIKKFKEQENLSWKERYENLEQHHVTETIALYQRAKDK